MTEMIDRIEALGKLQNMYIQIECACGDGNLVAKGVRKAYKAIELMTTIEAEPVRQASWKGWTTSRFTGKYKDYDEPEFKDYQYYTCTACYRKSAIKELYCPNCGAKMDGGDCCEKP